VNRETTRDLPLSPVLAQSLCVSQCHRQEIDRPELPKTAMKAVRLAEFGDRIGPASWRPEYSRHRMPTMAAQLARRTVVPGHDDHIGRERANLENLPVQAFDHLHLGGEVAVFARTVSVLVMQKEEVVGVPEPAQGFELIS